MFWLFVIMMLKEYTRKSIFGEYNFLPNELHIFFWIQTLGKIIYILKISHFIRWLRFVGVNIDSSNEDLIVI